MLFSLALLLPLGSANDDGLHLLQMQAHAHSATQKPVEEIVDPPNAKRPIWELKKRLPKFGPDGTWATPYCKSLLGCEPYCPDGCDGVAYWEASIWPPGLGNAEKDDFDASRPGAHFLSCIQGDKTRGRPPTPGSNIKEYSHGLLQCSGSENSTKKPFWSTKFIMTTARKDELQIAWGVDDNGVSKDWNSGGANGDGQGWGNEFCPEGCVNDCAEFKLGGFLTCGVNRGANWAGYDGGSTNAVGPNQQCPQNAVTRLSTQMAYTWCGEQKKRCKVSEATKQKIKDAKAARKAARAALKLASQAFKEAKQEATDECAATR